MKKALFIFCVNCFIAVGAMAQNSALEALTKPSKAESFLNNTSFYKEVQVSDYSDNGLELYGRVFVNLKNESEKLGAIEFRTESKMARAFWTAVAAGVAGNPNAAPADDGSPRPLGYLDLDEVNSLISALKKVSEYTKGKYPNDFTLSYIAPGGINLYYKYEDGDQKMFFRKAWYSVNKFGTQEVSYISSDEINAKKNVDEIIKALQDTKAKIEAELKK